MSCSKEEAVQLQETPNAKAMRTVAADDLQKLYDNMVQSPAYKISLHSVQTFVSKMGPEAENVEFDSNEEAKMLEWIEDNISKTTFTNFDEAKSEWDVVKRNFEVVLKENPKLANPDFKDDDWDRLVIPNDGTWDDRYEAYSDDPCIFGCINTAERGRKAAEKRYNTLMSGST